MQICKPFGLTIALLSIVPAALFAQMKMPEMPSITNISDGPAMPRITAPTLGSTFYIPGKLYTKPQSESAATTTDTTENAKKTEAAVTSLYANQINSLFGAADTRLTASDVSELGNSGSFAGIYGLLDGTSALASYAPNASNTMLKEVIQRLEKLSQQNDTNGAASTKNSGTSYQAAAIVPSKIEKDAKILRFTANGKNLLDSCRTVYFSKKEYDGSFLLTGDCKAQDGTDGNEETFYLLFRADGNCGTASGFNVEPTVIQNKTNENSFLYKLSKKEHLKAEKTGNLVFLRSADPDFRMDLLLDIGSD